MTPEAKLEYLEELLNEYWRRVGDDEFEKFLYRELLKARLQKYKMEKNDGRCDSDVSGMAEV